MASTVLNPLKITRLMLRPCIPTRASYRLFLRLLTYVAALFLGMTSEISWRRTVPPNVAADADTDPGAEEGALNGE